MIRPVRDARGKVRVRVTVPTQNGWKAIALSAGARQELFISTDLGQDEVGAGPEEGGRGGGVMPMTSRERVLAAVAHKEPDRVPLDHGSMRSTGIMAIAYNRLKAHLGAKRASHLAVRSDPATGATRRLVPRSIPRGCGRSRPGARHAQDGNRGFLPDGSPAMAPAWFRPEHADGELLVRGPGGTIIGRMPEGALFFDQCHWPLSAHDGLDD